MATKKQKTPVVLSAQQFAQKSRRSFIWRRAILSAFIFAGLAAAIGLPLLSTFGLIPMVAAAPLAFFVSWGIAKGFETLFKKSFKKVYSDKHEYLEKAHPELNKTLEAAAETLKTKISEKKASILEDSPEDPLSAFKLSFNEKELATKPLDSIKDDLKVLSEDLKRLENQSEDLKRLEDQSEAQQDPLEVAKTKTAIANASLELAVSCGRMMTSAKYAQHYITKDISELVCKINNASKSAAAAEKSTAVSSQRGKLASVANALSGLVSSLPEMQKNALIMAMKNATSAKEATERLATSPAKEAPELIAKAAEHYKQTEALFDRFVAKQVDAAAILRDKGYSDLLSESKKYIESSVSSSNVHETFARIEHFDNAIYELLVAALSKDAFSIGKQTVNLWSDEPKKVDKAVKEARDAACGLDNKVELTRKYNTLTSLVGEDKYLGISSDQSSKLKCVDTSDKTTLPTSTTPEVSNLDNPNTSPENSLAH